MTQTPIPLADFVQKLRDSHTAHIKLMADAQVTQYGAAWATQMAIDALVLSHPKPEALKAKLSAMRDQMIELAKPCADPGAVMYKAEQDIERFLAVVEAAIRDRD